MLVVPSTVGRLGRLTTKTTSKSFTIGCEMAHHFKGVPWEQIMGNEFEYLSDKGYHDGHLAEKFLKKYCSYPKLSQ